MITLGIETSCDETALALLETKGPVTALECCVLSSLVHSQAELHSAYGGVFPTLAKREHGKNCVGLLHKLIIEAEEFLKFETITDEHWNVCIEKYKNEIEPQNPELFETFSNASFLKRKPIIDTIAVTEGPGLEPALWVGITFARMLSELWNIPVKAVNHMEGHIVGSLLPSTITNGAWHTLTNAPMPSLAFLISGGHTEFVSIEKLGSYKIIGETVDDAVGEAFDKAARLLGLPYPGGPYLSELAGKARMENIPAPLKLPRPMTASGDLQFSFSGLKTAVLYATRSAPRVSSSSPLSRGQAPAGSTTEEDIDENWKKGLAREFEDAVVETLNKKLRNALEKTGAQSLIIGGGVSANHVIRRTFEMTAQEYGIPIYLPSRHISGDNALMIALAGALDSNPNKKELKAEGTKRL